MLKNIGMFTLLMTLGSCYKSPEVSVAVNSSLKNVKTNSASVSVKIDVVGDGVISQSGVIYSTFDTLPKIAQENYYYNSEQIIVQAEVDLNDFQINLEDLQDNGYYYCRPFAIVNGTAYYGEVRLLKTDCPGMGRGPAGGYKFYNDGNGGGFEAAPYDILDYIDSYSISNGQSFNWKCRDFSFLGISDDLGSGASNTLNILSACDEENSIADRCNKYSFNGYDDWYLPSIDELKLMYDELESNNYGKFHSNPEYLTTPYASSSTSGEFSIKAIDFKDGVIQTYVDRSRSFYVRPIRNI